MKVLVIGKSEKTLSDIMLCLKIRYPETICIFSDKISKSIEAIGLESPDLLITDLPLNDANHILFINKVREFSDVPLIIIGSEAGEMDKARALEAGADEYIYKPINCIELLAITNSLLRRTKGLGFQAQTVITLEHNLTVNLDTHEITRSGQRIRLTPMECKLLSVLLRNRGQILSHRILLERAWGSDYICDLDLLKKGIYKLRSKLEVEPHNPNYILSERGFGYRFTRPS